MLPAVHPRLIDRIVRTLRSLLLGWVVVLTGCAVIPIQNGMERDAVIARMGVPTRVVVLASGTRLQYSGQPANQETWMVDLDPQGRVVQMRQVLQTLEFARIEVGIWTRADMLREFGPPASIDRVASWPHDILTYRWRGSEDMFYWVYLDDQQRVQRTEQGVEYHEDHMM